MIKVRSIRCRGILTIGLILSAGATSSTSTCLSPEAAAASQTQLNGAGATFPYPIYSKWFDEYHKVHPEIEIVYQPIGSRGGIDAVTKGTADFGATDGPLSDDQMKVFQQERGVRILHFPTIQGADVPVYNIVGVNQELKFTPESLAGIFLGKIKQWNDPELSKANPGVDLPGDEITVVHRSDGSGTTYIWADYLSKISSDWKDKVGKGTAVKWPVGLGSEGNEGVSNLIARTPNSIGYLELTYAIENHLAYGVVKNFSGNFVKADFASVTAAATGVADLIPGDFRVSITNVQGQNAYPISSFTWLLVPAKIGNQQKKKVLTDFLRWMLTDGQKFAEPLAYVPLPKALVSREIAAISLIR
jgi:phosphate transport system substrate-binding protein